MSLRLIPSLRLDPSTRKAVGRQVLRSDLSRQIAKHHGTWRSLVSALVWGTRGRRFKSGRPDVKSVGK